MGYQALNDRLTALLSQFDLNQSAGGCSLVIFHGGKLITALAHGTANIDKHTHDPIPWSSDTLSLNFSTGKGVLVTLVHVLVSNQRLAYDTPIAHYWQQFAQNGKNTITLRDILTHESGLFNIVSITEHAKDMLDWETMLARVEKMPANQDPNTPNKDYSVSKKNAAYSALVSGWVLGGLIEKATQMPLQQALEHYLLAPLGLVGQAYFGVPTSRVTAVASQLRKKETHSKPVLTQDTPDTLRFYQSLPFYHEWQAQTHYPAALTTQAINELYFQPSQINMEDYKSALVPIGSRQFNYYHPATLQAKIPAANGVASAFALARIYAMLANQGRWQDTAIISAPIFAELSKIHNQQFDKIMPAVMAWRLGYHRVFSLCHDVSHAFGHMGYNGSMAWCDPSRDLALAFVHNYDVTMLNDIRQFIINETVLDFFKPTTLPPTTSQPTTPQ